MSNLPSIDYLAGSSSGRVLFRPLTPRALEAFHGLPLDAQGCYLAADDEEANALFDRFDEAGLEDLTA